MDIYALLDNGFTGDSTRLVADRRGTPWAMLDTLSGGSVLSWLIPCDDSWEALEALDPRCLVVVSSDDFGDAAVTPLEALEALDDVAPGEYFAVHGYVTPKVAHRFKRARRMARKARTFA